MNPYLVLGVPLDADDRCIRQRYLDAIRAAPPEHDPKRFQELTTAYQSIQDERCRHRYMLFNADPGATTPLEAFLTAARAAPCQPPDFDTLKQLIRSCLKP